MRSPPDGRRGPYTDGWTRSLADRTPRFVSPRAPSSGARGTDGGVKPRNLSARAPGDPAVCRPRDPSRGDLTNDGRQRPSELQQTATRQCRWSRCRCTSSIRRRGVALGAAVFWSRGRGCRRWARRRCRGDVCVCGCVTSIRRRGGGFIPSASTRTSRSKIRHEPGAGRWFTVGPRVVQSGRWRRRSCAPGRCRGIGAWRRRLRRRGR